MDFKLLYPPILMFIKKKLLEFEDEQDMVKFMRSYIYDDLSDEAMIRIVNNIKQS